MIEIVESKNPEHYACSIGDFFEIFSHVCIAEYRIKDFYIVPEYVSKSLEVPTTLVEVKPKIKNEEWVTR